MANLRHSFSESWLSLAASWCWQAKRSKNGFIGGLRYGSGCYAAVITEETAFSSWSAAAAAIGFVE
jgi:hypothetical protein